MLYSRLVNELKHFGELRKEYSHVMISGSLHQGLGNIEKNYNAEIQSIES